MRNRATSKASTLAVSLSPEEAVCYLARIYTVLVLFDPPEFVRRYRGRVLIHSLGFPDDPEIAYLCKCIMDEFGFDATTFPALAFQGLATISTTFQYDAESFMADEESHGYRGSLRDRQAEVEGEVRETWGIRLTDTYFLPEPISDVLPPFGTKSGCFWLPQTPAQQLSFATALKHDISLSGR